jgi:hypothetical protein
MRPHGVFFRMTVSTTAMGRGSLPAATNHRWIVNSFAANFLPTFTLSPSSALRSAFGASVLNSMARLTQWAMEHEKLEFKIVMDDGPDNKVLARLAHLDLSVAAFMAAVTRFPNRNIDLLDGASVIKRHEGAPKPEPPPSNPNMRSWSVSLIGGRKMQHCGTIFAISEEAAIEAAAVKFGLDEQKRRRLAVTLLPK